MRGVGDRGNPAPRLSTDGSAQTGTPHPNVTGRRGAICSRTLGGAGVTVCTGERQDNTNVVTSTLRTTVGAGDGLREFGRSTASANLSESEKSPKAGAQQPEAAALFPPAWSSPATARSRLRAADNATPQTHLPLNPLFKKSHPMRLGKQVGEFAPKAPGSAQTEAMTLSTSQTTQRNDLCAWVCVREHFHIKTCVSF